MADDPWAAFREQPVAPAADDPWAEFRGPSVAADVAKSGGVGLAKGVIGLGGMGGDARELISSGVNRLVPGSGQAIDTALRGIPLMAGPTSGQAQKAIEGYTGEFYKPQTTAGKYAHTIGEFAPGALMPGGALVRAAGVVLPAVASEAAGQATEGTSYEPYARVVGAVAGALAPSALRRVVTPNPASPERARMVQALEGEGVNAMTAGQRTGSHALRFAESSLGDAPFAGGQAQRAERTAREQFTAAALRRAGANANEATPEVLAANQQRLSQAYDDLATRGAAIGDQRFAADVTRVAREYVANVLPTHRAGGTQNIQAILTDIVDAMRQNGGAMPGTLYQSERSRLTRMSDSVRQSDPQLAQALRGVRNALDDAFDRSLSPADRALRAQTNREYRAQKTIEKAASRAGEATGEGMIVPANLRNEIAGQNRGAYARGQGDMTELARAGATVMTPMPQSGTAPRSMIYNLSNLLTGGVAPAAAGRALMSRPVQGYLGNQLLPNMDPYLRSRAGLAGLLAGDGPPLIAPPGQ